MEYKIINDTYGIHVKHNICNLNVPRRIATLSSNSISLLHRPIPRASEVQLTRAGDRNRDKKIGERGVAFTEATGPRR